MSTHTDTIITCDACGKKETNPKRSYGQRYKETEEWRRIVAGYRHSYSGFNKTEFDVCSWACAKQIHAKFAEVEFDRKSAENEAKVVQWALDQAEVTKADLEAKTARVAELESQLRFARATNADALAVENSRLSQRVAQLEHELREARKLDREELAYILRSTVDKVAETANVVLKSAGGVPKRSSVDRRRVGRGAQGIRRTSGCPTSRSNFVVQRATAFRPTRSA